MDTRPGDSPARTVAPVRLLSAPKDGTTITVCLLDRYKGFTTHYQKPRSYYCSGPECCPSPLHKLRPTWKGYAPCEAWNVLGDGLWTPAVLEVTEKLNELWQGLELRGTVWVVQRLVLGAGVKEATADLVEERNQAELPQPFPIIPTLSRIYGRTDFAFIAGPVMPARVFLSGRSAAPPPSVTNAAPTVSIEEHRQRAQKPKEAGTLGEKFRKGVKYY
jgi:hypothetical protein